MEISTGRYIIVESGSLIIPEDDYVEFNIQGARFRFVFISNNTDETDTSSSISGTLKHDADGDYLEVEIYNYNSAFSSPSQTLKVGNIDDKLLYINFSVTPLADNSKIRSRIMIYSWYKEK